MSRIKTFFQRVFSLDPELEETIENTDKLAATLNGEYQWMLECKPDLTVIKCDNGKTYEEMK